MMQKNIKEYHKLIILLTEKCKKRSEEQGKDKK